MDEFEKRDTEGEITIDTKEATIKDIAMEQLKRITRLSSVELRGGFWATITNKEGKEKEIYVEDSREILSNAILCLAFLVQNSFDPKMEGEFKDYKDTFKEKKAAFLKLTKINDKQVLGEGYYKGDEKKLLEEFKIEKLHVHQNLLACLCLFLHRKPMGTMESTLR